jgi:hypothetical protein
MPTEKEFAALESAIVRLSREYEILLFGKGGKLPLESRRRVQDMIRAMASQKMEASAERYRFNTLMGRFNAECERWERALRDKEEGRSPAGRPTAAGGIRPNVPPPASVKREAPASPDRQLFERYIDAKTKRGEDMSRLTYEKFQELLRGERAKLLARTGKADWEFDVSNDAQRVRLVVRLQKGSGG